MKFPKDAPKRPPKELCSSEEAKDSCFIGHDFLEPRPRVNSSRKGGKIWIRRFLRRKCYVLDYLF
jgi:hypothetical protein